MATVHTSMNFLKRQPLYDKEKPYLMTCEAPQDFPKSNIETENVPRLQLTDLREQLDTVSFLQNGFELIKMKSHLTYQDFGDEEKVKEVFLREAAEALRIALGATRVQVFEHLIRKRHDIFPIATGEPYEYNQPTSIAHIDTTLDWAAEMVRRLNPDSSEDLLRKRYQCVNLWKPLRGPVRDWPLALCDYSTVNAADVHPGDLVYADFVIENCQLHYSPEQRWVWVSDQTEDEAWAFLQTDSHQPQRPGVPHSSFPYVSTSLPVEPRESIELRALVYYSD